MCGLPKRCLSGGEKTALLNSICDAWGEWGGLGRKQKKKRKKETLNSESVRKQRGNRNCGSARNLPFKEPTNHRETKRNRKIWY